jgi:hypothetical protein
MSNPFITIPFKIRRWWWYLRHDVYYQETVGEMPVIQPSGGDDTANIQMLINKASEVTNLEYIEAKRIYDAQKYKIFHREPVLKMTARLVAGTYSISAPIIVTGSDVTITGKRQSNDQ